MRRALLVLAIAAPAHADPIPNDIVSRPLVLGLHQLDAQITGEVDLAPGEVAHEVSLAPDLWFGLTDRWTIGIVHSNQSVDQIMPGSSFCVVKEDIGCDQLYHGSGLDLLWGALAGDLAVAPRARFLVRDINFHNTDSTSLYGDATKTAATLGATLQWTHGRYALWADPYVEIGFSNSGSFGTVNRGNRAALFLPIAFVIQPTCRWALELHTGWNSDFAVITDGWDIPIEGGVRVRVTRQFDVVGSYGYHSLLGPQNDEKGRAAFLTVGWRS